MSVDEVPAGREIDAEVAEKFFGWKFIPLPDHNQYGLCSWCGRTTPDDQHGREKERGKCDGLCQFSEDIAAAWQIVEKINELDKSVQAEFDGYFVYNQLGIRDIGAETICLAVLAAVRVRYGAVQSCVNGAK